MRVIKKTVNIAQKSVEKRLIKEFIVVTVAAKKLQSIKVKLMI